MTAGPIGFARLAVHVLAITSFVLCLVLPASPYAWVTDLEPDLDPAAFADAGGDRAVALGALITLAIALELLVGATAPASPARRLALALALVVAGAGLLRHLT